MIVGHHFIVLSCFVAVFVAVTAAVSPTKSPECDGMNKAKASLQKGIQTFTKEPVKCLVNDACTGVSCNGTHKAKAFYMSIELHHCLKPHPQIHLNLVYPAKNLDIHKDLTNDAKVTLYKMKAAKVILHLSLTRKQNRISSSLALETCAQLIPGRDPYCQKTITLIPETTFCVNMNTCPAGQFNTTGYTPCHLPPPPPSTAAPKSTSPPTPPPTGQMKTTKHASTSSSKPRPTHSTGYLKTTQSIHGPINTTSVPEPGVKGHQKGDGHHHMSVGVAVGIGFAVIACILIVVGVLIYWKKFHHRSRLRAAYYNDISMNDPLYEDFGPEVA